LEGKPKEQDAARERHRTLRDPKGHDATFRV